MSSLYIAVDRNGSFERHYTARRTMPVWCIWDRVAKKAVNGIGSCLIGSQTRCNVAKWMQVICFINAARPEVWSTHNCYLLPEGFWWQWTKVMWLGSEVSLLPLLAAKMAVAICSKPLWRTLRLLSCPAAPGGQQARRCHTRLSCRRLCQTEQMGLVPLSLHTRRGRKRLGGGYNSSEFGQLGKFYWTNKAMELSWLPTKWRADALQIYSITQGTPLFGQQSKMPLWGWEEDSTFYSWHYALLYAFTSLIRKTQKLNL